MKLSKILLLVGISISYSLDAIQVIRPLRKVLSALSTPTNSLTQSRAYYNNNFSQERISSAFRYRVNASYYWETIAQLQHTRKEFLSFLLQNNSAEPTSKIFYSCMSAGSRAVMSYYLIPIKFKMLKGIFDYHTFDAHDKHFATVCFYTLRDFIKTREVGYHASINDNIYSRVFTNIQTHGFIPTFTNWRNSLSSFARDHNSANPHHTDTNENSYYHASDHDTGSFTQEKLYRFSLTEIENRIKQDPSTFFGRYNSEDNTTQVLTNCIHDIQNATGSTGSDATLMLRRILVDDNTVLRMAHPDSSAIPHLGSREKHALFILINNLRQELKQV